MKLCLDCVHCQVDPGSPGYSEYTPAEGIEFRCLKGHFDIADDLCRGTVKSSILKAETCGDFESEGGP